MSVQISVPLELLQKNAAVAEAVSALLGALTRKRGPGRPPGARPSAAAPAAQAVSRRGGSKAPRSRKAQARSKSPDASKKLVEVLKERGPLTTAEGLTALGMTDPRALGGMVGSMNRWAKKRSGAPKIKVAAGEGGAKTYELG